MDDQHAKQNWRIAKVALAGLLAATIREDLRDVYDAAMAAERHLNDVGRCRGWMETNWPAILGVKLPTGRLSLWAHLRLWWKGDTS